jgi:hypothetical protein
LVVGSWRQTLGIHGFSGIDARPIDRFRHNLGGVNRDGRVVIAAVISGGEQR